MSRAFVGEWIFSHALFDWDAAHDERYLADVLLKPPSWLGRNPTRPPTAGRDPRAILAARDAAGAFVDWCADRVVEPQPRIVGFTSVFQQQLASLALAKRIKARLPDTFIVMGGANCEATMGVETVRQFPFVDAVVSGEADRVFAELAVRVVPRDPAARGAPRASSPRRSVAGLIWARPAPTAPAVTVSGRAPVPRFH